MKFNELNLHELLQQALAKIEIEELTEVQEKAIPAIQSGKDVTILSQTGTGKTFSFLIPVMDALLKEGWDPHAMGALVIAPTRELAIQIAEEGEKILVGSGFVSQPFYGGQSVEDQMRKLQKGCTLGAFTPGRLIDLLNRKALDPNQIQYLIIDEADRLFDMGFIDDVKFIVSKFRSIRQTVLASATLSREILELAREYLRDPVQVEVNPTATTVEKIRQSVYHLGRAEKDRFLVNYLKRTDFNLIIIFVNTKIRVAFMERLLQSNSFKVRGISGAVTQKVRTRLIQEFREGKFNILVATDVASRGLDIDGVSHVFNYDLPDYVENYVHRIGRTARAGRDGEAVSFCSEFDYDILHKIESFIRQKIEVLHIEDELLAPIVEISHGRERGSRRGTEKTTGARPVRQSSRKPLETPSAQRQEGKSSRSYNRDQRDQRDPGRMQRRPYQEAMLPDESSYNDDEPMVTVYKQGSYIDPIQAKQKLAEMTDRKEKSQGVLARIGHFLGGLFRGSKTVDLKEESKPHERSNSDRKTGESFRKKRPHRPSSGNQKNVDSEKKATLPRNRNKPETKTRDKAKAISSVNLEKKSPELDKEPESGEKNKTPRGRGRRGGSSRRRRSNPNSNPNSNKTT